MDSNDDTLEETIETAIIGETDMLFDLDNREDNTLAASKMTLQARRTLRIFSYDLDRAIYDQMEFISACKQMALSSRFASIQILAVDSKRIMQRGHRLIALARALSSRIEIRQPEKQYQSLRQTFLTVDERGYIYRKSSDRYEGVANFYDPRRARELDKQFVEIWQKSQVDPEMRSLNI